MGELIDNTWCQTYMGLQFWPTKPEIDKINIEDIAHSLSMQCRFNGHVNRFYSVAEHCVLVSRITKTLDGLMHDAAEAYISDIPRPIKNIFPKYKIYEQKISDLIYQKFSIEKLDNTKYIDDCILHDEKEQLMPNAPSKWELLGQKLNIEIYCWEPKSAKKHFLKRFKELII